MQVERSQDEDSASSSAEVWRVVRSCWPLLLGHVLEWYDFSVYGYQAEYMQKNFFQGSRMATWAGFAVTFAMRPLGGVLFGFLADSIGRRPACLLSMSGMLLATTGQGLLPIGSSAWSLGHMGPALLIALRMLQGLSTGGEIGAMIVYMNEIAPLRSLGMASAVMQLFASIGFLCADAVVALVVATAGPAATMEWAWRLPFFAPLLPGLVAAIGRLRLPESALFLEEQSDSQGLGMRAGYSFRKLAPSLRGLLKGYSFAIVLAMGSTAAANGTLYVGQVWSTSFLTEQGLPASAALWAGLLSQAVTMAALPVVGHLTDLFGVGSTMLIGCTVCAICALPLFVALTHAATSPVMALLVVGVGFALLRAAVSAQMFLFCAELFPTRLRGLGVGLSYNLGCALFGGPIGMASQLSLRATSMGPGIIMAASGAVSAGAVVLGLGLQAGGKVQLAHRRPEPYFCLLRVPRAVSKEELSSEAPSDMTSETTV